MFYLDPETVSDRIVIIFIKIGVTSNPKCTDEETVGAVWYSGAIIKNGNPQINFIDREAFRGQVLWSKEEEENRQLDIVIYLYKKGGVE